jgi:hypothetical protein
MFDSVLAFNRYRLEVVRSWPASEVKDRLLAAIEFSLRKGERPGEAPRPEGEDLITGARDDWRSGF